MKKNRRLRKYHVKEVYNTFHELQKKTKKNNLNNKK